MSINTWVIKFPRKFCWFVYAEFSVKRYTGKIPCTIIITSNVKLHKIKKYTGGVTIRGYKCDNPQHVVTSTVGGIPPGNKYVITV